MAFRTVGFMDGSEDLLSLICISNEGLEKGHWKVWDAQPPLPSTASHRSFEDNIW